MKHVTQKFCFTFPTIIGTSRIGPRKVSASDSITRSKSENRSTKQLYLKLSGMRSVHEITSKTIFVSEQAEKLSTQRAFENASNEKILNKMESWLSLAQDIPVPSAIVKNFSLAVKKK